MRESFGTRLRRQRQAQHVAIASIAAATKISGSLFSGLERDDVRNWPSGIYRRSFIRAYAEAIGLDPDSVCLEFTERFPDPGGHLPGQGPASPPLTKHLGEWQRALASSKGALETVGDLLDHARLPKRQSTRWRAAAWDIGGLLVLAFCALAVAGRFWLPLGAAAICYHLGGTLLLGKSPSLWWLDRRAAEGEHGEAPALGHIASLR
jgi:transcriptional regulator with XRE-family HTH domain